MLCTGHAGKAAGDVQRLVDHFTVRSAAWGGDTLLRQKKRAGLGALPLPNMRWHALLSASSHAAEQEGHACDCSARRSTDCAGDALDAAAGRCGEPRRAGLPPSPKLTFVSVIFCSESRTDWKVMLPGPHGSIAIFMRHRPSSPTVASRPLSPGGKLPNSINELLTAPKPVNVTADGRVGRRMFEVRLAVRLNVQEGHDGG